MQSKNKMKDIKYRKQILRINKLFLKWKAVNNRHSIPNMHSCYPGSGWKLGLPILIGAFMCIYKVVVYLGGRWKLPLQNHCTSLPLWWMSKVWIFKVLEKITEKINLQTVSRRDFFSKTIEWYWDSKR